jgi:hypothetical protein
MGIAQSAVRYVSLQFAEESGKLAVGKLDARVEMVPNPWLSCWHRRRADPENFRTETTLELGKFIEHAFSLGRV